MTINYSVCGNCNHRSRDHDHRGNRKCRVRSCSCPGFKPKGS